MPKIRPAPNSDDTDVDYGNVGERVGLDDFLAKCKNQLGSLPPLIPRNVRHRKNSLGNEGRLLWHFLTISGPLFHSMATANLNKSEEVRGLKFLKN